MLRTSSSMPVVRSLMGTAGQSGVSLLTDTLASIPGGGDNCRDSVRVAGVAIAPRAGVAPGRLTPRGVSHFAGPRPGLSHVGILSGGRENGTVSSFESVSAGRQPEQSSI